MWSLILGWYDIPSADRRRKIGRSLERTENSRSGDRRRDSPVAVSLPKQGRTVTPKSHTRTLCFPPCRPSFQPAGPPQFISHNQSGPGTTPRYGSWWTKAGSYHWQNQLSSHFDRHRSSYSELLNCTGQFQTPRSVVQRSMKLWLVAKLIDINHPSR